MFIGDAIKKGNMWEPHIRFVLEQILDPEKVSLNIGAHIGSHTVTMAKKSKKVYAFEPQPMIHWLLRLNLFDNGLNNFETFNKAVGNKKGMVTLDGNDYWSQGREMRYDREEGVNYGAVSIGKGGTEIEMITIDGLNIEEPISAILVDVEGAECAVFWGAKNTIRKNRPSILFERNDRKVTPQMEKICEMTSEIKDFKIEDFVSDLNYNPLVFFGEEAFLIPMPDKPFSIPSEFTNGWKYDGKTFFFPGRKNAKMAQVKNDLLMVIFPDDTRKYFFCTVGFDGSLVWSNGDRWVPKVRASE
jgi:FkbM family methyltransferase